MKYTRLFSLLLAAVLSVSLLAGCASGSSSADSAAGSVGAASQSVPSSTAQANAGSLRPSFDENALLNTADTAARHIYDLVLSCTRGITNRNSVRIGLVRIADNGSVFLRCCAFVDNDIL